MALVEAIKGKHIPWEGDEINLGSSLGTKGITGSNFGLSSK